jgi:hypothetical protein
VCILMQAHTSFLIATLNKSPFLVFIDSFIIAFSMPLKSLGNQQSILVCGNHSIVAYLCRLKLKSNLFIITLYRY